jgi:signal transduction histidine kinase
MKTTALTLGATGTLIALSTAVVSLGDRGLKSTSYATSSPGLAVLASLTGVALFGAATLLAAEGSSTCTALATFALGAAWSADVWAGWSRTPAIPRNLAMLLLPLGAPLVLFVVASTLGRTRLGLAGAVAASVGTGAGLVLWFVRDPYVDRYCWRDCLAHSFAPFGDVSLARTATHVTLALNAACAGFAVVLAAAGIARRTLGRPLLTVVAAGAALLVSNITLRLQPAEDPTRRLFASVFVANGIALAALGLALASVALRPRFVRRAVARLAVDPGRWGGGLTAALGTALGDPGLRVGYQLSDGPVVDAEGMPIVFEAATTQVVRGGQLVALVGSSAGAPPRARLERALGPAAKLALANERLHAEQLFRQRELTALRRRLVAAGDAARRSIERDLHDGAQQRLLALAIDLQVALKRAQAARSHEAADLITAAAERLAEATAELRRIAHGIFPSTLANAGLVAALESLADERRLVLSIGPELGRRFPAEIEAAVYALAAEASTDAIAPVRLALREQRSALVVELFGATLNGGGAEDRIGAAGGTLGWSEGRLEAVLPMPPHPS